MNDHSSKQFDLDLENIRTRILRMGGMVEQQVISAIDALGSGDLDSMERIIETDRQVDDHEVGIDADCTRLIARRQPTATDLRLVMAISRIVTDLERVGDKAVKIARMSMQLHGHGHRHLPRIAEIRSSGALATGMLRRALDSLARMDVEAAKQVLREDPEIDRHFNALLRQSITYMMEDPRTISESLDIIWIAKAVERIGDHACNIAENVVYIVSGVDIRHIDTLAVVAD